MEKTKQNPVQTLMEGVGFTEEDLAANSAGRFSDAQHARLTEKLNRRPAAKDLAVSFLPVALVGLCVLLTTNRSQNSGPSLVFLIGGAAVLVLLFNWFADAYPKMQVRKDLQAGSPQVVEGRIQFKVERGMYFATIEGTRLPLKQSDILAFKNGDPYRIYYAPYSKTILSAEWLRDDAT